MTAPVFFTVCHCLPVATFPAALTAGLFHSDTGATTHARRTMPAPLLPSPAAARATAFG